MSQRTPTLWKPNPAKTAGVAYSSSSVAYSSSTTPYSSANVALDEFGKTPEAWTPATKTPTRFVPNSAANANLYPYDSGSKTYDSAADTFDGVVSNQEFANQNSPTAWSPL